MDRANLLRGIVFNFFLFFSTFFGSIFMFGPVFILLCFSIPLSRKYVDFWASKWLVLPGSFFELIHGTKLVLNGDRPKKGNRSLIISNHRCRLDWMFFWMAQHRIGRLANTKIILKEELKYIPGPGWAMQFMSFLFLRRKWDYDKLYFDRVIAFYERQQYPLQLFIFPEGTDMYPRSIERSHKFADTNNLPRYEYVLHPRTTGFTYLVQQLREKSIEYVYDVTMAYPKGICYGEGELLRGKFPNEVHICFKEYRVEDLPEGESELAEWCAQRWAEKEVLLKHFYENSAFIDKPVIQDSAMESSALLNNRIALVFWYTFTILSWYLVYQYLFFRYWCYLAVAVFSLLQLRGGIDSLQMRLVKGVPLSQVLNKDL